MRHKTPRDHRGGARASLRPAAALVGLLLLVGCVSSPSPATLAAVRSQANPTDVARRNITNFTPALRCMDERLFALGVRDVTLMMEEMRDATLRVPVSTRDMMTSAISDMTRRSRAIRLSVFGSDQQNLTSLLQQAQRSGAFQAVPSYAVRGAVSQFDEGVERSGQSLGLAQRLFGLRLASELKFSVMAFDAALVDTERFALVPGVSSKNQTVLATRDTQAGDGEARLSNPGLSLVFAFSANRSDGVAQAARNMVELAVVELVGKLLRVPYWQCLNVPDEDPEVQRETEDWFLSLDDVELRRFLQGRLRELRYHSGAVDGQDSPVWSGALALYRRASGLPEQGPADLAFFRRVIMQPAPRAALGVAKPAAGPVAPSAAASSEPALQLLRQPGTQAGLNLLVQARHEGFVYCYAQDATIGTLRRVFPNRQMSDPHITPGKPVQLRSSDRLVLPDQARYACLMAGTEIYADLPAALRWGDFEPLKLPSFEAVQAVFAQVAGGPVSLHRLADR